MFHKHKVRFPGIQVNFCYCDIKLTVYPDLAKLTVFLSKTPDPSGPFEEMAKANSDMRLVAEPLIKTTRIPFSYTPQTKWIFFSSKNAIRYFFEQASPVPESVKIGVISAASEEYLKTLGKHCDFVGQGTDLVKIGKDFAVVLQNDSVLFPQAIDSLRTIQKQIAFTNTLYNLYTYKTIIRSDIDIPYADVLIFTSPSNVEAYLRKYKIDIRQIVIAMGATTKFRLSQSGTKDVLTPATFNEQGLFDTLCKAVSLR